MAGEVVVGWRPVGGGVAGRTGRVTSVLVERAWVVLEHVGRQTGQVADVREQVDEEQHSTKPHPATSQPRVRVIYTLQRRTRSRVAGNLANCYTPDTYWLTYLLAVKDGPA